MAQHRHEGEQTSVPPAGAGGPGRRPAGLVAVVVLLSVVGVVTQAGLASAVVLRSGLTLPSSVTEVLEAFRQPSPLGPDDPIDGVVTYEELGLRHTPGRVDYGQRPPVGGDHAPVWQNCGFYGSSVPTEQAVHSLEHGAVWVTFDPDLPEPDVEALEALAATNAYLLVSPMRGLPSPVVASAWGVQLQVGSVDDRRLPAFLARYQQGPQTPEPGAPCSGGSSDLPEAPVRA